MKAKKIKFVDQISLKDFRRLQDQGYLVIIRGRK